MSDAAYYSITLLLLTCLVYGIWRDYKTRQELRAICAGERRSVELRPNALKLLVVVFSAFLSDLLIRREVRVNCQSSPCGALRSLCDLVPSPILRKRVTKLVADQEYHIDQMLRQGRYKAAHFNRIGTWFLFFWYIIQGVVLAVVPFRQKRSE